MSPHTSTTNLKILLFAAVCSGLIYGYNAGVYGGVVLQIQAAFDLNSSQLGHLISIFDFAEIVGVLLSTLADRIGRRTVLIWSAVVMSIAPFLLLLEPSFTILLVERAISGCFAGLIFMIGLIFVAEVAPPEKRATLLSCVMIGVSAGYVAELAMSVEFVDNDGWRYPIVLAAVPAIIQVLGLLSLRESPVFYRMRGQLEEAQLSEVFYGLPPQAGPQRPASQERTGLRAIVAILQDRHAVRNILLGLVIVLAGTMSGGSLGIGYGPLLMERFGVTDQAFALEILIVFTISGFAVGFIALIPISRGHTPSVLTAGLLIASASLFLMFFVSGYWAVALLGALQLGFSFGIRTTIFQLLPSFLDDASRVAGMAFYNLVFIFLTGLNKEFIPVMLDAIGAWTFLVFSAAAFALAIGSALALWARDR